MRLPQGLAGPAQERAADYDGGALRFSETRRDDERKARVSAYRQRLIEGPVLALPALGKFSFSFDPSQLVPIDDDRTAYPALRVTDEWGILEVTDGALLVREGGRIVSVKVESPKDKPATGRPIQGHGWKLDLAAGWRIVDGERPGDTRIAKE